MIWNKQFLIFLFFLAISLTFWFFQTLNETYEQEVEVPVEIKGVPTNVVITSDTPRTLRVNLRDRGVQILNYLYAQKPGKIIVDFNANTNATGFVSIPTAELLKQIAPNLASSTQVTSVKPETLEYFYNYGQHKRVPVAVQGTAAPKRLFSISKQVTHPDSVTVYAAQEILDTITAAYTRPLALRDISDTTHVDMPFQSVRGAKFVPASTQVDLYVDRLVEKTVRVPVQQVNFPAAKQLRTFPAAVNVTFQVGMSMYRQVTKENFVIVINYEDLLRSNTNKCHLSLKTVPEGVSHARITPQEVEFIIEEIPDNENETE